MKTKFTLFGVLFLAIFYGCSSSKYLPAPEQIDVNQFGSLIKVVANDGQKIRGELLAIDSVNLIVLKKDTGLQKSSVIPLINVKRFTLRYARPKHYGWTIPVSLVATIAHGWYLSITAPVSLIVTVSVTAAGEKAYTYNNKMSFNELKMFARFPQGIPANIDLARIK